jgi:hypothetical protein
MRKWKQLKKSINIKSLLNLELNDKEKAALNYRKLKVKDGKIIPKKGYELLNLKELIEGG